MAYTTFRALLVSTFSVFIFFASAAAFAWGGDGHRIVCAIAWEELRAPVRFEVENLLGIHSREAFVDLCLWADEYRDSGHRETSTWHYVNVPKGATTVDLERDCAQPKSCVVDQIERDIETLRGKAPKEDKATALKFLMHFVGDIHQPLHVGHSEDRGGNAIKGKYFGKKTDMHALWDFEIIERTRRTWQQMAHDLSRRITQEKRRTWSGSAPMVWAQESLAIVNSPEMKYARPEQNFEFSLAYEHDELPVVRDRLSRAGVRLGYILNDVFKGDSASKDH